MLVIFYFTTLDCNRRHLSLLAVELEHVEGVKDVTGFQQVIKSLLSLNLWHSEYKNFIEIAQIVYFLNAENVWFGCMEELGDHKECRAGILLPEHEADV